MFNLNLIIGLKVHRIVGNVVGSKRVKNPRIEPNYILFDDGETYIDLEEQDYFTYHDCSSSARIINTYKNKLYWENLNKLPDANNY